MSESVQELRKRQQRERRAQDAFSQADIEAAAAAIDEQTADHVKAKAKRKPAAKAAKKK